MNSLQTANAPSPKIVIPHFIAGALFFIVATILLAISNSELMTVYYDNKLVAITHILVLGWASMIIFGALYQLIPVVYETSLYSEKLAEITFWMFLVGSGFLSYSFWVASFSNLLFYAAIFMLLSLSLFIINLLFTYKKTSNQNIQSKFINTSIYWLALTALIGTIIAVNFRYNFLDQTHLHYLKVHAHFGLIGWFLLLIIGASSILIPMFMVSHNLKENKLNKAYYLINIALVLISIDWLFIHTKHFILFYWLLFAIGIFYFISYVYDAYKMRLKKKLDIALKYTIIATTLLVLPLFLALILSYNNESITFISEIGVLYVFSILFGFISMLIFGMTYKTLPFIVWLYKYQSYVGKQKTPFPRELYSEKIANYQFYIYLFAISFMVIGIAIKNIAILQFGSFLLIVTGILNLWNILKIVFHKTVLKPLT